MPLLLKDYVAGGRSVIKKGIGKLFALFAAAANNLIKPGAHQ